MICTMRGQDLVLSCLKLALVVLDIVATHYAFELIQLLIMIMRNYFGSFRMYLFEKFFLIFNVSLLDLEVRLGGVVKYLKTAVKWEPFQAG